MGSHRVLTQLLKPLITHIHIYNVTYMNIYIYTHTVLQILFLYRLLQNTELVPCATQQRSLLAVYLIHSVCIYGCCCCHCYFRKHVHPLDIWRVVGILQSDHHLESSSNLMPTSYLSLTFIPSTLEKQGPSVNLHLSCCAEITGLLI